MGMRITIHVDGTVTKEEWDSTSLEDVQQIVGGYIEAVPYFNMYEGEQCQAWCDEEGKLKPYGLNDVATELWEQQLGQLDDVLVGDICILTGSAMLD